MHISFPMFNFDALQRNITSKMAVNEPRSSSPLVNNGSRSCGVGKSDRSGEKVTAEKGRAKYLRKGTNILQSRWHQ